MAAIARRQQLRKLAARAQPRLEVGGVGGGQRAAPQRGRGAHERARGVGAAVQRAKAAEWWCCCRARRDKELVCDNGKSSAQQDDRTNHQPP